MKTILTLLAASLVAASAQAQSLIPQTQEQTDLQDLSRNVNGALYYSQLWADALTRIGVVWSLPDDRLEAVLEALGQERVTALLQLMAAQAQVLNVVFEAAGVSTRVNATPAREFSWNSPTDVVIVPLPEPEQEGAGS